MVRRICVVLLLVAIVKAQDVNSSQLCDERPVRMDAAVKAFQSSYYEVLPRGHEETIAVVPYVPQNKYGCCPSGSPNQKGLVPIQMDLQPVPGLDVRYRVGHHYVRLENPVSVPFGAGQKFMLLKVAARPETTLGMRHLPVRFTFRTVHDGQLSELQSMDVPVSLKIAEHDAKVEKADWPLDHPVRNGVVNTLLFPVKLPVNLSLALLLLIFCHGSGCDL